MKKMLLCTCLLLAVGLFGGPAAQARESAAITSKPRKVKAPKTPLNTGYGESRKERDQRLLRECRGKPNAGACEGYAQ